MSRLIALLVFAFFSFAIPLVSGQIIIGGDSVGGTTSREVPFTIEGGHILLDVTLDGHGPYPFYFDSGAVNLLSPDVAQELNLESKGAGYVAGFGKGHPAARFGNVGSLKIGTLALTDQGFLIAALPNHMADRGKRPRLAGLIGGNLLQRYAAEIDFDRKMVRFVPGGAFSYAGKGRPVDLGLAISGSEQTGQQQRPFLQVTLDSTAASLLLDTGSVGTALLYPNSRLGKQLLAKPGARLHLVGPGGIGGVVSYEMLRADNLQIGDIPPLVEAPFVSVVTDGMGYQPNVQNAGVLGLSSLGYYNFTIDYPHNRVYLEPRPRFAGGVGHQALRGTGLELTKDQHDRFKVIGVIAGSAAERAGIVVGDEIFAIDGKAAVEMALFDAQAMQSKPVFVALGPEGHRRPVSLEPQILLP